MSTKVKESLFELIKSLSKSEKRYFKLLSSRHTIGEENNYVRLFDYIDKQEAYDENALFKEFKNEAFITRFSITKKRLYDHILSSLDAFHSSASNDAQLYKLMHSADILYTKSLYDQCGRVLRSAEKLAEKHEKFNLLSEIRRKQKKLIENTGYANTTEQFLEEVDLKDKAINNQIELYNNLWKIKSDLFLVLSRKGRSRNADDSAVYSSIINRLPLELEMHSLPFETAYLFYHIQSAYWFAIGNLEKSYLFLKANIENFEKREGAIESNLNNYFSLLTNAIYVSEKLSYHQDAADYLKVLKSLTSRFDVSQNEDIQIKLFASSYSIELSILSHQGEFAQVEKLIPAIEKGLKDFGEKISPGRRAFIQFKLATIELGLGNYSNSLKWLNLILNNSELDSSEDILSYTQILDLLVHLEMKHDKLLPYALKNTQRFLKSRNRLYTFEKVFLSFVSKRIKCENVIDAEILWEELYKELSKIKETSCDGLTMEIFDFISWAESKFKRQSFTELLKEKFSHQFKKAG